MSPPTYLSSAGLAFGLLPFAIGLNAFLRPASGLAVFQIPTPTEPYGRRVALGLMRVYGSRNMAIGLSVLAMWYYSQFKVMGWACLAGCIMTTTDGFVAREVVGGKEWPHWSFTPISIIMGLAFLRSEGVF